MRVLIVEDDPSLARGIVAALVAAGYAVDRVDNGRDGLSAALEEDYALVVLDLGLPQMDGLTVLKALRQAGSTTPVMILTARDAIPDRVAGLDVGADDYPTKPFALEEFEARVRSLVRRGQKQASPVLTCGALSIDRNSSTVTLAGRTLFLRPRGIFSPSSSSQPRRPGRAEGAARLGDFEFRRCAHAQCRGTASRPPAQEA